MAYYEEKKDDPAGYQKETELIVSKEKKPPMKAKNTEIQQGLVHEDWEDIIGTKCANTPEDLIRNMSWFDTGKWVEVRKDDCYMPVLYKGKKCIFETPPSICLFGLESYHNPDSSIKKYSLNFCLRTDGRPDMEEFVLFLNKLDQFTQSRQIKGEDNFLPSMLMQKRNKSPTLRIKVPNYKNQLNIKIILKQSMKETIELAYPTLEEFQYYIKFNTRVSAMLLINNIWRAGGKYGISFKLLKLRIWPDIEDIEFRDP